MRGVPAPAIQRLAGHSALATTERYMHLSPTMLESAIRMLEAGSAGRGIEDQEQPQGDWRPTGDDRTGFVDVS